MTSATTAANQGAERHDSKIPQPDPETTAVSVETSVDYKYPEGVSGGPIAGFSHLLEKRWQVQTRTGTFDPSTNSTWTSEDQTLV